MNAGAVGTIIFNNTSGTINLALDGYEAKAPCVSISQAEGEYMKSSAKPVTDQAGNVLYYLGSLTITDEIDYALRGDEYQSMSYFSSWGVPSSLELKPEITAPGGNIYSLDGVTYGGKGYANNFGTSMASPTATQAPWAREKPLPASTPWPRVCPRFRSCRGPVSHSSACTRLPLAATQRAMISGVWRLMPSCTRPVKG